jgi:hypothetical protein
MIWANINKSLNMLWLISQCINSYILSRKYSKFCKPNKKVCPSSGRDTHGLGGSWPAENLNFLLKHIYISRYNFIAIVWCVGGGSGVSSILAVSIEIWITLWKISTGPAQHNIGPKVNFKTRPILEKVSF